MKNRQYKMNRLLFIVLIIFFLFSVLLPVFSLFKNAADADWKTILSNPRFIQGLKNSISVSITSTVISVLLGYAFAWCIERCAVPGKNILKGIFTLPMLIPSLSLGTGVIILLGNNGLITGLFNSSSSIYGFKGIVFGSVLYSFPVAFMMISDMLSMEDGTPYEAARVMNIDKFHRFTAITFPYIKKPMISVIFAVFTMIITDYGVPLMVGGQYTTLPVIMYQDVIGMLDFKKGSVIGIILLIPAVIAFIADSLNKDDARASFTNKHYRLRTDRHSVITSSVVCIVGAVIVILPIIAFLLLSFATEYPVTMSFTVKNIISTFDMKAGRFLLNSVLIGLFVAAIGTITSFASAYITVRTDNKSRKLVHFLSVMTLAIPGIALGLSYTLFFSGSALYGTLAILILVNIIHFLSSPYLMMYNALGKVNPNIEAVGDTLSISRISIIFKVIIPMVRTSIFEALSYFFVNSMMTISAVAFLSTRKTQPISLMIQTFEAQMMIENIGVVSLIILIVNLIVKGIFNFIRNKT